MARSSVIFDKNAAILRWSCQVDAQLDYLATEPRKGVAICSTPRHTITIDPDGVSKLVEKRVARRSTPLRFAAARLKWRDMRADDHIIIAD